MKQLVLTGYPLDHSLSPIMQNAALSALGLNQEFHYVLHPLTEDKLNTLVESIRGGTIFGANITIPYKIKIMEHIDAVSDEGLAVGSVNTLYKDGSKVVGFNTDVTGVIKTLGEHELDLQGSNATILGAGGSAKAVAYALAEVGIDKLEILNRTLEKAEQLASVISNQRSLKVRTGVLSLNEKSLTDTDIIVNCTPIGMRGHSSSQSPIPESSLHEDLIVMDLVYNPLRSRLLQDAQNIGCKTINGTSILVHQGAQSLEIWTGQKAPVEVMRSAVQQALGGVVCLKGTTNKTIGLIGFMGTGKTTIGKALASATERQFVDTDKIVENRAGKTISEIFSEDGEDVFRKMESQIVTEVCDYESCVISFGGGVVLSPLNIETIRKNAVVVLLKASVETIASRISLHYTRPLLDNGVNFLEHIKALLVNREVLYDKAMDLEIDTDTMSVESSVEEIKRRLCL